MKLPDGFRADPSFKALAWRAAKLGTVSFADLERVDSLSEEDAREFYSEHIGCQKVERRPARVEDLALLSRESVDYFAVAARPMRKAE